MGKVQRKRLISTLKQKHGDAFVAKALLSIDKPYLLGDDLTAWGATGIAGAVFSYMKKLVTSFSRYANSIGWQDILQFTDGDEFPIFDVLELISQLSETVTDKATTLACKFVDKIMIMFEWMRGVFISSGKTPNPKETQKTEELEKQLANCVAMIKQLGERGVSFIQWVAGKIKSTIGFLGNMSEKIFEWLGSFIGAVASAPGKLTKFIATRSLQLCVFIASSMGELWSWSKLRAADAAAKTAQLGKVLWNTLRGYFESMMHTIGKNDAVAFALSGIWQASGMMAAFVGGDSLLAKALRGIGGAVALAGKLVRLAFKGIDWLFKTMSSGFTRLVAAIARKTAGPLTNFLGEKLGIYGNDLYVDFSDSLKDAEWVARQIDAPEFLRDAIADAREVQDRYDEAVKQREEDASLVERLQSSWVLSGALIKNYQRKELNQQERRAVARNMGSATAVSGELIAAQMKLDAARTAAVLKSAADEARGSPMTTQEEDEEFAMLWKQMRVGDRETEDFSMWTRLQQAFESERITYMETLEDRNAPEDAKMRAKKGYDDIWKHIEEKKHARGAANVATRRISLIIGIALGLGAIYVLVGKVQENAEEIDAKADAEQHDVNAAIRKSDKFPLTTKLMNSNRFPKTKKGHRKVLTQKSAKFLPRIINDWIDDLKDNELIEEAWKVQGLLEKGSPDAKDIFKSIKLDGGIITSYISEGETVELDPTSYLFKARSWWHSATSLPAEDRVDNLHRLTKDTLRESLRLAYNEESGGMLAEIDKIVEGVLGQSVLRMVAAAVTGWLVPNLEKPVDGAIKAVATGNTYFFLASFAMITTPALLAWAAILLSLALISFAVEKYYHIETSLGPKIAETATDNFLVLAAFFGTVKDILLANTKEVEEAMGNWFEFLGSLAVQALSLLSPMTYALWIAKTAAVVGKKVYKTATTSYSKPEAAIQRVKDDYRTKYGFVTDITAARGDGQSGAVQCEICPAVASYICGDCNFSAYCGDECWAQDEIMHEMDCDLVKMLAL